MKKNLKHMFLCISMLFAAALMSCGGDENNTPSIPSLPGNLKFPEMPSETMPATVTNGEANPFVEKAWGSYDEEYKFNANFTGVYTDYYDEGSQVVKFKYSFDATKSELYLKADSISVNGVDCKNIEEIYSAYLKDTEAAKEIEESSEEEMKCVLQYWADNFLMKTFKYSISETGIIMEELPNKTNPFANEYGDFSASDYFA